MATIGPNISFQSIGPAGVPDIAYSNLYAVIQSPWGVADAWQVCTSFAEFTKLYGGLNKLTTVASGLTADTYTTETDDDVVQGFYAVKSYFDEKGAGSPGVAFISRVIATSSGPTAGSATFADQTTNNTTITSKWPGRDGNTTQIYIINPSPRRGVFTLGSGTVAVTSGTTTVTCSGSNFTTGSTWVGYGIKIGTNYYTIASVTNATTLELDENANATETAAVWSVGSNTAYAYINAYHPQSGIREEWDLAPTAASAADISRKSQLITVTLPVGLQLPKTTAPGASGASKLNAGSPGTADSYAATAANYVGTVSSAGVKTGLQVFNDQRLGTGFVTIPGQTSATVKAGLTTHSASYYRVPLHSTAASLTLATAQTELAGVSSGPLAGAGYVPRIWVTDVGSSTNGQILVDNVGAIAGLAARMHREYGGPHKSPAGLLHPFVSVVDIERQSSGAEIYDDAAANTLADVNMNTIRISPAGGFMSWGMRTLSSDERYRQINQALTVCLVYHSAYGIARRATFEPIDSFGKLFAKVKGDLDAFFFDLWQSGALYGNQPGKEPKKDDAWYVVCDKGNNPNVSVGKGELRADVSFVATPNAEKVTIPILVAAPGFGAAAAGVF